jgi:hypothetical protein
VKTDTLVGFADASYGVHSDGRSQSADSFTLGTGSIYSSSTKQKITTKSSSEAELVAASDTSGRLLAFRNYLISRKYITSPAVLGQDNLATKQMLEKGISSSKRTRHLNIRYFFVKDYVEEKQLNVSYISTNDMIADVLTKPIQGKQFQRLRDKLLGLVPDCWLEDK